jgi:hypothetical protein
MKTGFISMTLGFFLAAGLPLAATAGPTPGGPDWDGDTVEDAFDNCGTAANPGQEDDDHDGCGNACDPDSLSDANRDGCIDFLDFIILSQEWGNTEPPGPTRSDANGDTVVDFLDFIIMSQEWGEITGPSCITNPSRNFEECPSADLGDGHGCVGCP